LTNTLLGCLSVDVTDNLEYQDLQCGVLYQER